MSTRGAESDDGGTSTRSGQTRGLSAADETSIDNLWMLLFAESEGGDPANTADDELVSVEQIGPEAITPTADPNEYGVRLTLPEGAHRVVMLANAAELNAVPPPHAPIPEDLSEVTVGNTVWAPSNPIPSLGGTATFQSTPYVYDGANQLTWVQATGDAADQTAPGVCPSGWRLPTSTEFQALYNASATGNIAGFNGTWSAVDDTNGLTLSTSSGSLFFSASGRSGGASNEGVFGRYWASTKDADNGHRLYFVSSNVNATNSNAKTDRFSVRCVRDALPEPAGVGDIAVGQTYGQVDAALVGSLACKMYEDGGSIPMWGESGMITTGADEDIHIDLHRAIARIDVEVADGVPFEMTQVVVARPNDKYSVIPAAENLDADGVPDAPTIPDGATAFSIEDSASLFTYTGSELVREIYVPEALIGSVAFEERMAVVIGGRYNGSDDVTWYRIDFKNANGGDGLIDAIVRNHLYTFTVSAVRGAGSADVETAYRSEIHNMTVSVVDWNEVHFAPELR